MSTTFWGYAERGETCYQFTQTDDPRVVAVIERDPYATMEELFDGDAISPIIYVEHRRGLDFRHVAGYDGGEAELMQQAYEQWGWNTTARRWLWIFHGIAAENADGGYDRSGNWIVATSRSFREHVGADEPATYDEARKSCEPEAREVSNGLDGEVYGVGYAVNEGRRLPDDEEIDLFDPNWEVTIECWGHVGEGYAQRTALGFEYGRPNLPEMLEVGA